MAGAYDSGYASSSRSHGAVSDDSVSDDSASYNSVCKFQSFIKSSRRLLGNAWRNNARRHMEFVAFMIVLMH